MKEFITGPLKIVVKTHNISLFSEQTEIPITSELVQLMDDAGSIAWKSLSYHDVTGFGNDYSGYYDKKFDNNGSLDFSKGNLSFVRPYGAQKKLYQFNKAKFETFMYDLQLLEKNHD